MVSHNAFRTSFLNPPTALTLRQTIPSSTPGPYPHTTYDPPLDSPENLATPEVPRAGADTDAGGRPFDDANPRQALVCVGSIALFIWAIMAADKAAGARLGERFGSVRRRSPALFHLLCLACWIEAFVVLPVYLILGLVTCRKPPYHPRFGLLGAREKRRVSSAPTWSPPAATAPVAINSSSGSGARRDDVERGPGADQVFGGNDSAPVPGPPPYHHNPHPYPRPSREIVTIFGYDPSLEHEDRPPSYRSTMSATTPADHDFFSRTPVPEPPQAHVRVC